MSGPKLVPLCLLGVTLLVAATPAPEVDPARPLDGIELSQRLLAGPTVVLASVRELGLKATLQVERYLRGGGEGAPTQIKIAYRGQNLERDPAKAAFEPRLGERAVFVLGPPIDEHGDPTGQSFLVPRGGYRARIPIPLEGGEALLVAITNLIVIQDEPSQGRYDELVANWLAEKNPWLVDAALDLSARFGIDDPQAVGALFAHSHDASPLRRGRALQAIANWMDRHAEDSRLSGPERDIQQRGQEALIRLARSDDDPGVRRTAVKRLIQLRPEGIGDLLRAIAKDDPAQEVRYEAAAGVLITAPH